MVSPTSTASIPGRLSSSERSSVNYVLTMLLTIQKSDDRASDAIGECEYLQLQNGINTALAVQ